MIFSLLFLCLCLCVQGKPEAQKLQVEIEELKKQEEEYKKKEDELAKKERVREGGGGSRRGRSNDVAMVVCGKVDVYFVLFSLLPGMWTHYLKMALRKL